MAEWIRRGTVNPLTRVQISLVTLDAWIIGSPGLRSCASGPGDSSRQVSYGLQCSKVAMVPCKDCGRVRFPCDPLRVGVAKRRRLQPVKLVSTELTPGVRVPHGTLSHGDPRWVSGLQNQIHGFESRRHVRFTPLSFSGRTAVL